MQTNLITPEYQSLCAQKHAEDPRWGTSSRNLADMVQRVIQENRPRNIVDYGCGKQSLQRALPQYRMIGYDPAIPGLDRRPPRADLVICTDVLEHIEPECLDAVLDDLKALTVDVLFLTVATTEAKTTLPDGRNAHLIVEPMEWWLPKLWKRFAITDLKVGGPAFTLVARARKDNGHG